MKNIENFYLLYNIGLANASIIKTGTNPYRFVPVFQLQVQNSVFNFLGAPLVPELCSDVAAGTTCNIHLALVGITTLGTGPDQLSVFFFDPDLTVKAAALAIITLGIQLSINNIVINKLHQFQHSISGSAISAPLIFWKSVRDLKVCKYPR